MKHRAFRDPRKLGRWVCVLTILIGLLKVARVGFELHIDGLRQRIGALTDASAERGGDITSLTQLMHKTQMLQGLFQVLELLLFVANVVLFCIWIHRAASNARALGARGFYHSPGWTVGWFFIPFASAFMPYFTVREVWQSSENPMNWSESRQPLVVLFWWVSYVAAGIVQIVAAVMLKSAKTDVSAQLAASHVGIAGSLLMLLSIGFMIELVRRLGAMQLRHWTHPSAEAIAITGRQPQLAAP